MKEFFNSACIYLDPLASSLDSLSKIIESSTVSDLYKYLQAATASPLSKKKSENTAVSGNLPTRAEYWKSYYKRP